MVLLIRRAPRSAYSRPLFDDRHAGAGWLFVRRTVLPRPAM